MVEELTETASVHWPKGQYVNCKCPHCENVDAVHIASVRESGANYRPGECSACFCEYLVVAKEGVVSTEKQSRDLRTFLIQHHYDIGDQGVSVKAPAGFDAKRAAVYLQFKAEEWFGDDKLVTNLGIAAALVSFYGCEHTARNRYGEVVDMYYDRERLCPTAIEIMADTSLARDGLKEFLSAHVEG